jgi:hypothetical protein
MSIIYSYPTTQPTVDDLLIGTDVGDDNATKSFTVQSLVSLINAAAGSGTVTGITISNDAFITAVETSQPGAPAITYTIGLAATGTPSAATFLRGDNKWVTPTVSAGISVLSSNIVIDNDLQDLNFTGAGVVVSSTSTGGVTVTVDGASQGVTSLNVGTGISTTATTGNVVVTNSGVTSIVAGGGIAIDQTTGAVTISTTGQNAGTVTSVTAGAGLRLASGTINSNPELALNYGIGSTDNYINQQDGYIPDADSLLPHYTQAAGQVYQTRIGDIPLSALSNVNTAITNSTVDTVKNDTDTYTSLGDVEKVITLTATEYLNLGTKDGNTLYLTTTSAPTTFTKTLAITDTITGGALGTDYTYTGNVAGNTLTGPSGNSFAFNTGISVSNPAKYFSSGPVISNATGVFDANNTVTTSISGIMSAVPPSSSTSTLNTSWNIGSGYNAATLGTDYSISYNAPAARSGTTNATFVPSNVWNVAVSNDIPEKWSLTGDSVTYGGTFQYQNNTITANILGTMTLRTYDLDYTIDDQISGGNAGTAYDIDITGSFGTLQNQTTGTANLPYNANASAYSIVVNVQNKGNNTVVMTSANPVTVTSNLTQNTSIPTITLTGSVSSNAATISVNTLSNPSGPAAGYTVPTWTWQASGSSGTTNGTITGLTGSFPANVGDTVTISAQTSTTPGFTAQYPLVDTLNTTSFIVAGNSTVTDTRTGTVIVSLYPGNIANIGGSSDPSGTPGSACNGFATLGVYTARDASAGYIVGDIVYTDAQGLTLFSTNQAAWYKSGSPGQGIVNFNSSGAIQYIQSC